MNLLISIVIPVYKNEMDLSELVARLIISCEKISPSFEIILINDGSPDNSWQIIKKLASLDNHILGVSLSKNFGQQSAIFAGIKISQGDWVIVMDADLQDSPEEIPQLFNKALQENSEIVIAKRKWRKDDFLTKFLSKLFYKIYNLLIEFKYDGQTANFGIYSRKVVKAILLFQECNQSFGYLANSIGFSPIYIDVNHLPRKNGVSSYTYFKKFNLAFNYLISNSIRPLKIIIFIGLVISFLSFLVALFLVTNYFLHGATVPGWISISTALALQLGIITFSLGFIALYIGNIFIETKNRPRYIINEITSERHAE
jgi:dolichol-phosphate mannosyltransferase